MSDRTYNVLFLCTGNSARSIMAECILAKLGAGRFRAFSAGSQPKGSLHAGSAALLRELGHDTSLLRSKSWLEFTEPGAPRMDFVFTVCDSAARESCPVWPGQPHTAHWGVPDPANVQGPDEERARRISRIYLILENRIRLFTQLPIDKLDRLSLQARLREIGGLTG
jgi:protein-tyrosine-phosphatase